MRATLDCIECGALRGIDNELAGLAYGSSWVQCSSEKNRAKLAGVLEEEEPGLEAREMTAQRHRRHA